VVHRKRDFVIASYAKPLVVNPPMDDPFTNAENIISRVPAFSEAEYGTKLWCFRTSAVKNEWKPEILSAVIGALQREFPRLPTFEVVQLVWNLAHLEPEAVGAIGLLRKARISAVSREREVEQEGVHEEDSEQ
jgi:hypothetical protein